jgi:hypothetical protein
LSNDISSTITAFHELERELVAPWLVGVISAQVPLGPDAERYSLEQMEIIIN